MKSCMNLPLWSFCLVVGCLACSKSSTGPNPEAPTINGPYTVTALLNDSTWFGSAHASRSLATASQSSCSSNRFNISFSTDLPFNGNVSGQPVTGCSSKCDPTQILGFYNIPLAVGKYELSTLNECTGRSVDYLLVTGGDIIIKTYNFQRNNSSWIQVTGYNASQKAVEGIFEVVLSDKTAQTVRFQKGAFKALIAP